MIDENLQAAEEFSNAFAAAQTAAQIFEARLFEFRLLSTEDTALRTEIDRILDLLSIKLAEMQDLMDTCNAGITAAQERYEDSQNRAAQ
jgi:hypothetical protein